MENRKRGGFGAFLRVIIILAIISAVGYVGYKTYQKMPVLAFVNELAQSAAETDMKKLAECFAPDSDVKKALNVAEKIENIPILGTLVEGAVGLVSSRYDFQVDYTDIRLTVNGAGNTGEAVIGIIDKNRNDQKSYITLKLKKVSGQWYATELPAVQSASEVELSYKNTLQGFAERASDYIALLLFSSGR